MEVEGGSLIFFFFKAKKLRNTLRSGKVLASGAAAPSAIVPPAASRAPSPFFCLEKEKNERRAQKAEPPQPTSQPFSLSLARPLRWYGCKVPSANGPCHRRKFLPHCLRGIARRLSVGSRFSIEWERFGAVQTSNATVLRRTGPTEVYVKYNNLRGEWPFPPRDAHTFVRRVALPEVFRHNVSLEGPPFKGLTVSKVRCQMRAASLGSFVRLRFEKKNAVKTWSGVVVWVGKGVLRVKWFTSGLCLFFPPPRAAQVTIISVRFSPGTLRLESGHASAVLRRKRFLELLKACETAVGSGAPTAHEQKPEGTTPDPLPNFSKRKRTLTIATLNPRSLCDDAKVETLCGYMSARRVDILVLPETKRSENVAIRNEKNDQKLTTSREPPRCSNFGWYEAPGTATGQQGIAVLISPKKNYGLQQFEVLYPHRVVALVFESCVVIGVYAPTYINVVERSKVFDAVSTYTRKIDKHKPYYVVGDLNARPQQQCKDAALRTASDQLDEFILNNNLHAANVDFSGKGTPHTHKASTLDYVLVRHRFRSSVQDIVVLAAPFDTDHKVLEVDLKIKWKSPAADPPEKRADVRLLREPKWAAEFATNVLTEPFPKTDLSPIEFTERCQSAMQKIPKVEQPTAARPHGDCKPPEYLKVGTVHGRSWTDPIVKDLLYLQSVVQLDLPANTIPTAVDSANMATTNTLVAMFAKAIKDDPRKAHRFISGTRRKTNHTMPARSNADRMSRFQAHFKQLYSHTECPPAQAPSAEFYAQQLRFNDAPFTLEELDSVLKSAKDEKAAGIDEVPNEVLKIRELRTTLLHVLNEMLRGNVGDSQKETILVPLFKQKGDPSLATNYRGISLMPHLTKLFDALIYHRLSSIIDPHLHPNQNGFRPDRGTTEHILTLSLLRELAATHDFPIHGCFVDFSKAFDSVTWESIQRQLDYWHVPKLLQEAIWKIMKGHVIRVRVGKTVGDPIAVEKGVLQGDTLAPFLFILVADSLFRKLPEEWGVLLSAPCPNFSARQAKLFTYSEIRLHFLAFADDVALFSHSLEGLQKLFSVLEKLALEVGLKINMGKGKTERFILGLPSEENKACTDLLNQTNDVVPLTDNYRYLGVWALNFEDELLRKKGRAWAAVKKVDSIWHSNVCMKVKRQLFRSIVEPVMTYGLCAWSLTAERKRRVDGMFGRILRYCLGLQPAYLSHDLVNTEQLYGEIPFLSTMLTTRRLSLVAHTLRAHLDGRHHSLTKVLLFEPSGLKPLRGPRITIVSDLLRQCRVEFREQLVTVMNDRPRCRALIREVEREQQEAVYHKIFHRRVLHALSYFEMPRKASHRRVKFLNENDSLLDMFMAAGTLRKPPTIWIPPRPTLPSGCICFQWHHFRWLPKPSINHLYVKPLTRKQEFAMARDRALQAEKRRRVEQQRRALRSKKAPCEALPTPRTFVTRSGRTVALLTDADFAEDEEEDPALSET